MARRMGPQDSATSHAILDAVETVLRTRGYGAITSRSVAEVAGVRQQLIYYYFQTVDDMLLIAFQRRLARGMERVARDTSGEHPIKALWADFGNAYDARLIFEYIALANHHDGIRAEVAKYLEQSRALQVARLQKSYEGKGVNLKPISPAAVVFLVSAINMMMAQEVQMGVTATHQEVLDMVDHFLSTFD